MLIRRQNIYGRQLKNANITPIVTWKVVAKVFSDTKKQLLSKIRLTEKVFKLNKSELIYTCRHQNKLLLKCLRRNNRRH